MLTLKSRGFTIVELVIVIVVIGILASISVVAYNGAQSRARDTTRKADVNRIADALALYYNDNRNYVEDGSGCGWSGNGSGWFSHADGGSYPKSISDCLKEGGYLPAGAVDPSGATYGSSHNNSIYVYMKYHCTIGSTKKAYVFAKLENGPNGSTNPISDSNICANSVDTSYGMNYYVEVK